jgi:hypothetical protein
VQYFPGSIQSREVAHPIFYLPQKRLLAYTGKFFEKDALTPIDKYLLFLATLNSTDLVDFRVPAIRTPFTESIIAQNYEHLVRTIIKLNTVLNPSVAFPRFVITPDTRHLGNINHWIDNWASAYQDFKDGYRSAHESAKLIRREAALERMIKNPHKSNTELSGSIAEWAATAGSFPTFITTNPFAPPRTSAQILCSEYWKLLIIKAAKGEWISKDLNSDLRDLLEHCEINIPFGSIYSHKLFSIIRGAFKKQENYLGFDDVDISEVSYHILSGMDTAEAGNLKAIIDSAPIEEPRKEQYPDRLSYIRAQMRWKVAQSTGRT